MKTMNQSLLEIVEAGEVSLDLARQYSPTPQEFDHMAERVRVKLAAS